MKKIILILILIPFISLSNNSNLSEKYFEKNEYKELPQEIIGNWFNSESNYDWVCGIYENSVIYKNNLWNLEKVKVEKGVYQLEISYKNEIITLFLKKSGDSKFLLGESPNNLDLLIINKTNNSKNLKPKNQIEPIVFSEGNVKYNGYIKGFKSEMDRDLKIHIPNVVTGRVIEFIFKIKDNGTFDVTFPLSFSTTAFVRNKYFEEKVLFQPSTTLLQFIDLTEHSYPFKSYSQRIQRKRKSVFMGDNSSINNELKSIEDIDYFDITKTTDTIVGMNEVDYKNYCLKNAEKELDSLEERIKTNSISHLAKQIKTMSINYNSGSRIIEYEWKLKMGYSKIGKKKETVEIVYPNDFFNFIEPKLYNNPTSILTGFSYYGLIQNFNNGGPFYFSDYLNYFNLLSKKTNKISVLLSLEERQMLDELKLTKTDEDFKNVISKYRQFWLTFNTNNGKLIQDCIDETIHEKTSINRQKYLNLSSFTKELIFSQTKWTCNKK